VHWAAYRRRLESCLEHADVVKLSAGDAARLWPEVAPESVAESLIERGAALAVVTLRRDGAVACGRSGRIERLAAKR
jgi:sugar/nucleoside kinase (ribokinase family)